jgi:hypothetical protein
MGVAGEFYKTNPKDSINGIARREQVENVAKVIAGVEEGMTKLKL